MSKYYSEASEKGKIIVNKCLELGYEIDTAKLERLLILIHGEMLDKYNKPFFKESVISTKHGVMIQEVDEELRIYGVGFKDTLYAPIAILSTEENVINDILFKYGNLDVFKLNNLPELKILSENFSGKIPNQIIQYTFEYFKNPENKMENEKRYLKTINANKM